MKWPCKLDHAGAWWGRCSEPAHWASTGQDAAHGVGLACNYQCNTWGQAGKRLDLACETGLCVVLGQCAQPGQHAGLHLWTDPACLFQPKDWLHLTHLAHRARKLSTTSLNSSVEFNRELIQEVIRVISTELSRFHHSSELLNTFFHKCSSIY